MIVENRLSGWLFASGVCLLGLPPFLASLIGFTPVLVSMMAGFLVAVGGLILLVYGGAHRPTEPPAARRPSGFFFEKPSEPRDDTRRM